MDSAWKAGLEDVIAARSAVCTIDGAAGRLYYRGYEIGDLAAVVPADSHAAWFLTLLEGAATTPEVALVMDVTLTLHADHEFNASTFAARVAVATWADLHAAIVAAVCTLKGPSHGGANDDVLVMP